MTREEITKNLKTIEESIETIKLAIKKLEQTKWIPISEKLPKDGERVLATHLGGVNPDRQVIEHIYKNGDFILNWDIDMNIDSPTFGQHYMGNVIAWQPLPEPYKEESNKYETINLKKAKEIVKENYDDANCGIYNYTNCVGDDLLTVYEDEDLTIDICHGHRYFEVYGLSDAEFAELENYYDSLRK